MENNLDLNFFNILIAVGAIQGILFSLAVLLNPKYKSNSNIFLALLITFISLNNIYYWFIDIGYIDNIKIYNSLYIPWALLITPTYYYFVKSYLYRKKVKLHFKSFIIYPFYLFFSVHLFSSLYFSFLNTDDVFYFLFIEKLYFIEEYFSAFFTLFIIFITYKEIKKYELENKTYKKEHIILRTDWLKSILYFGILISFIWVLMLIISQLNSYTLYDNFTRYFLWIANSILIYYLGYLGIYYNGIFKERKEIRKSNKKIAKQENLTINNTKFIEIKNVILREKLFLNPNLSLSILAEKFHLNESYISSLFNKNANENLSSFINKQRIAYAKKLLLDNRFKNYTIISIGLEAGFNSKSAFYTAFKKKTSLTPTQFRKQNLS